MIGRASIKSFAFGDEAGIEGAVAGDPKRGGTDGEPAPLGRSPSSLCLAANVLEVHSVMIWKSVVGLLKEADQVAAIPVVLGPPQIQNHEERGAACSKHRADG